MYSKKLFSDRMIPKPITRANSLLKCDFGGSVVLGTLYTSPAAGANPSRNFIRDITGTDSEGTVWPTGFEALFGTGVRTMIQTLPSEEIAGANDAEKEIAFNELARHQIRTLDVPVEGKVKYLHNQLSGRTVPIGTGTAPQTVPTIQRSNSVTNDLKRLCMRQIVRLPANLDELLKYPTPTNAYWLVVQNFKSGGYAGSASVGEYRFKLQVNKGANGLYWSIVGDNSANGFSDIPSSDPQTTTYWQVDADNTQVPVFLDEWLEIYTFVKRPETLWVRETPGDTNTPYERDLTTGRTVTVMRRILTGQWYLIGDQVGGIQIGVENCIWTRFFYMTYSNAETPIFTETLELEFYDNLPFTLESKGLA